VRWEVPLGPALEHHRILRSHGKIAKFLRQIGRCRRRLGHVVALHDESGLVEAQVSRFAEVGSQLGGARERSSASLACRCQATSLLLMSA